MQRSIVHSHIGKKLRENKVTENSYSETPIIPFEKYAKEHATNLDYETLCSLLEAVIEKNSDQSTNQDWLALLSREAKFEQALRDIRLTPYEAWEQGRPMAPKSRWGLFDHHTSGIAAEAWVDQVCKIAMSTVATCETKTNLSTGNRDTT